MESAALVLVGITVIRAIRILIPGANTVHWLSTQVSTALNVAVSIWAGISVVLHGSGDGIRSALLVLVRHFIMLASSIIIPLTQAVHWLGTALGGALLVGVRVWASKSVVSSIGADSVGSAALVLMLVAFMDTGAVGAPRPSTVDWLTAAVSSALNLVVLKWTLGSTQVSLSGDLVGSATLILMAMCLMSTRSICSPFTFAVHGLAAAALGALN